MVAKIRREMGLIKYYAEKLKTIWITRKGTFQIQVDGMIKEIDDYCSKDPFGIKNRSRTQ